MTYSEALDEAICFGWIDGVRNSIDAAAYRIRFTPRKPGSQWSAVNIKRAKKLIADQRMTHTGLAAFAGAETQGRAYSYEQRKEAKLDAVSERSFRENKPAWEFFEQQPPWYRRTAFFWVISAKQQKTRQKRLDQLIADSARRKPIKPLERKPPSQTGNKK
ncbi:MAG TPA: YdeI/OmpD-associated family protein [Candidatus Sulfotelmatobacter sp.]